MPSRVRTTDSPPSESTIWALLNTKLSISVKTMAVTIAIQIIVQIPSSCLYMLYMSSLFFVSFLVTHIGGGGQHNDEIP